jgi:hypothetical protein
MAISIDHQAFIDILTLGQCDIGGVMQPPPEGVRGMPPEMLRTLRLRPRRGPEPRAGARNLPSDRRGRLARAVHGLKTSPFEEPSARGNAQRVSWLKSRLSLILTRPVYRVGSALAAAEEFRLNPYID